MTRQRQILVTVTYNDLGCIIDTKTEPYEEPNLQPTCNQLATVAKDICVPCKDSISRQAAIDALYHVDEYNGRSVEAIRNLPSAQSERMKGKWIDDGTKLGYCCSQCGITLDDYVDAPEMTLLERPNYCPNCGADMIGDCANGY